MPTSKYYFILYKIIFDLNHTKLMKKALYFSLLFLLLISCKTEDNVAINKIDFDGISETIKPGDNFFEYVNKTWLDDAVIADDQVGVGSYSFLNIPQKEFHHFRSTQMLPKHGRNESGH